MAVLDTRVLLFVCEAVCLCVWLSVCLCVWLPVCLSVSLSVYGRGGGGVGVLGACRCAVNKTFNCNHCMMIMKGKVSEKSGNGMKGCSTCSLCHAGMPPLRGNGLIN